MTGWFWFALVVAGLLTGILVVQGLALPYLALAAVAAFLAPFSRRWLARYGGPSLAQAYAVGATYLALLSTIVLRKRTTDALAENPLDSAAQYRVVVLALAVLLAGVSILLTRHDDQPRLPLSAWFYAGYIGAATLALPLAVDKGLVAFRVCELATFLMVFLAVYRSFRGRMEVPLRHVMFFVWTLMATAAVSYLISPTDSMRELDGNNRLKGLYPVLSADYLGILGTLSVAYGLGQRRIRWIPVIAGVAIVLAAQHRTGYVVVVVLIVLRLVISRRTLPMAMAGTLVALVVAVAGSGLATSQWSRGQESTQVASLSSRTEWWDAGLQSMRRSPVTGLGLSSGTRFEVFASLKNQDTPNLHGTLPEVLVGTGLAGTVCFVAAFASALLSAWRAAWHRNRLIPLLLLVALGINALTHTTFELGSLAALVFLLAGAAAVDPNGGAWTRPPRQIRTHRPPPPARVPAPMGVNRA